MLKKLNSILEKRQKINICILLIIMVVSAFFEMAIVSLVLPLVTVVMDTSKIFEYDYLKYFYDILGMHSENQFLLILILTMIVGYLVKNVFAMFMYYVQARIVTNGQYRLSKRLLDNFLRRPYEYYLSACTGDLIRIVTWDTVNVFSLINNILFFVSELVVFFALVILLLIVDAKMTMVIATIVGITMIISKVVFKKQLLLAGEVSQKYNALMNKWLIQSFEGIKEVKLGHKEEAFAFHYADAAKKNATAQRRNSVISQAPRLLIETASMCGMLGFLAIMIGTGKSLDTMMAQIATLGMAAVRLMPSANRMNTYLNAISFLEPSLKVVCENALSIEPESQDENGNLIGCKSIEEGIELKEIEFAYPDASSSLFYDANMSIPVGKSVAIIGPSGAGKTTIVDIMMGLLGTKKGSVTIDGIDTMKDYYGWLSKIGYIPQSIFMLDDSIKNNIGFGIAEGEISEERVWKVLEDAQLAEHVKSLPDGIDTQIGEKGVRFSGGQRQRLGIARALYHDPEILVFDEATSALDNETENAIMESINRFQGEKTMVIIAHRLETIKDCDIVYCVRDGKVMRQN